MLPSGREVLNQSTFKTGKKLNHKQLKKGAKENMKSFNKRNVWLAAGAVGLVLAGSAKAQQITLQLNESLVGSDANVINTPSSAIPAGAESGYYGVYQFQVVGGPDNGQTIWSTCLSPQGQVDYNPYTYTIAPFATAQPGTFPSAWTASADGTQLWGIQNAAYVWQQLGSAQNGLKAGAFGGGDLSTQDAGEALELAMFVALYDSTGYGLYNINSHYTPSGLSTGVQNDLTYDLGILAQNTGNVAAGAILVPNAGQGSDAEQEFILLDSDVNNLSLAPEPISTSMFGGLIAVLAFAGGSVRRKLPVITK
jgi:hypothetical protein